MWWAVGVDQQMDSVCFWSVCLFGTIFCEKHNTVVSYWILCGNRWHIGLVHYWLTKRVKLQVEIFMQKMVKKGKKLHFAPHVHVGHVLAAPSLQNPSRSAHGSLLYAYLPIWHPKTNTKTTFSPSLCSHPVVNPQIPPSDVPYIHPNTNILTDFHIHTIILP